MATWRQALEVVITDKEFARLMAVTRSRTEPASRVQRAKMLLAYRENPSFFAIGRRPGGEVRSRNLCGKSLSFCSALSRRRVPACCRWHEIVPQA